MSLLLLGLNHKAAPVEVRERLAVSPGHLTETLCALRAAPGVAEVAILSTCNRLEVYAVVDGTPMNGGVESDQCRVAWPSSPVTGCSLVEALASCQGLTVADFAPYLYVYTDQAAARHLCRVAAGLDSLLVGEYQILGQVKNAFQSALDTGACGAILFALFRQALHTGKRARTETEIGQGARSLGQVAVSLAREVLGELDQRTALIVGAGKMSQLAGRALVENGLRCLLVANRTFDQAERLACSLGGRAMHLDALPAALVEADLVIAATGAPHIVLHEADLRQALAARTRPLVVMDLAVPRNVDPAARTLPGLHLYDMDDLTPVVAAHHPVAAPAIAAAERIVEQEVMAFLVWRRERQAASLIQALCAQAEAMRQVEVEKTLHRLGTPTPEQVDAIHALSHAIVNKLLHQPITQLKAQGDSYSPQGYWQMTRILFGLDAGDVLTDSFSPPGPFPHVKRDYPDGD